MQERGCMKKYSLMLAFSVILMLGGCGQSQEAASAAEAIENSESNEILAEGSLLDKDSEQSIYSEVVELLDRRYELLSKLECEWDSYTDSRDCIEMQLSGDAKTTMYRVTVADSWQYFEEQARDIYTAAYVDDVLTPFYMKNIFAETDGKLYRAEADGFVCTIKADSLKIWQQKGANRYVVVCRQDNETNSGAIFLIRKADSHYEITDEVELVN